MTFYSKYHSLPIPKGSNRTRRKALLRAGLGMSVGRKSAEKSTSL